MADCLIPNFLQTLYTIAEQTNADLVHPSSYLNIQKDNNILMVNEDDGLSFDTINVFNKELLSSKIKYWHRNLPNFRIYNQLIRRDFLVNNNINFLSGVYMPEWIFYLQCLCLADNYVRIPHALYIRSSFENKSVFEDTDEFINGIEVLKEFMNEIDYFKINAEIRKDILKTYMKNFLK